MNDQTLGPTSSFSWTLFFLAGGVAGASLALLLAPQSPRTTRATMEPRAAEAAKSSRSIEDRKIREVRHSWNEARQWVEIVLRQRRKREAALVRRVPTASPGASKTPQA